MGCLYITEHYALIYTYWLIHLPTCFVAQLDGPREHGQKETQAQA